MTEVVTVIDIFCTSLSAVAVMALAGQPIVCALSSLFYPDNTTLRESKTWLDVPGNVWAIKAVNSRVSVHTEEINSVGRIRGYS